MSSSSGEFDGLVRLLKLKRYEQPPPRFFLEFPDQVINRLRPLTIETEPWWVRLGSAFRPALAGATAVVASGILLMAFGFAGTDSQEASAALETVANPTALLAMPPGSLTPRPALLADPARSPNASSTNPLVAPSSGSLSPVDAFRLPIDRVNYSR